MSNEVLLVQDDEIIFEDANITPTSSSESSEGNLVAVTNGTAISSQKWKNGITVEPMLLLHGTALYFFNVTVQSFYIDCICHEKFNTSICSNLSEFKTEEGYVEEIVSFYMALKRLIEAGLPVITALFLGAWSDKYGSKAPMVLSLLGYTCSAFLFTLFARMPNITPAILLIASIPIAVSGGYIGLVISAYRYISEISTVEKRSFRFALAGGVWALGTPLGLLGSAEISKYYGYIIVFLTAASLYLLALIYTAVIVRNDKERVPNEPLTSNRRNACSDIFTWSAITDTFDTCFKRRPGSQRMWIGILFFNFSLVMLCYGGYTIQFLYTRLRLDWDAEIFSLYSTIDGIIGSLGSTLATVILVNYFKIRDNVITLMSTMSYIIANSIFMIASTTWMMYLGSFMQVICTLTAINIRSILSKIVTDEEYGKIFAFLACFESAMPLLGNFLYNFIFQEAVDFAFLELVYMVSVIDEMRERSSLCDWLFRGLYALYMSQFLSELQNSSELSASTVGSPDLPYSI